MGCWQGRGYESDRLPQRRHLLHVVQPRRLPSGHHMQGQETASHRAKEWHRTFRECLSPSCRRCILQREKFLFLKLFFLCWRYIALGEYLNGFATRLNNIAIHLLINTIKGQIARVLIMQDLATFLNNTGRNGIIQKEPPEYLLPYFNVNSYARLPMPDLLFQYLVFYLKKNFKMFLFDSMHCQTLIYLLNK